MKKTNIQGVILAGGESSRFKQNKMSILIDGVPLLIHTINSMSDFVDEIIVVSGKYHEEIKTLLADFPNVRLVYNSDYHKGMFSSVKEAVRYVNCDFFLIPGDIPFVKKSTYQTLLTGNKDIRIPSFKKKTGHPVYISKNIKNVILDENTDSSLKEVLLRNENQIIEVDDPNILKDVDTVLDLKLFEN